MPHRRSMSTAGALVILALALPAASAPARPIDPINLPRTDVASPGHPGQNHVVNARGTDVAAPDQQAPISGDDPASQPADPFAADDGSPDTFLLVGLVLLAIGGIASGLVLSRKRSRAAV